MARPRSRELTLELLPPTGGVNLAVDENQLGPREALDIVGWELDEYGALTVPFPDKNLGVPVSAKSVLNATIFIRLFGTSPQLVAHFSDGSLKYSEDFRTISGSATWTQILAAGTLSVTAGYRFCTAFGFLWMSNGTDDLRRWDGSAITNYASAPKGTWITEWKDTLWITGSSTADRVYQSAPGDGTTWPALNFVDVGKGKGLPATRLEPLPNSLVVLKPQRIHSIYDPVEYSNRLVDDSKGLIHDLAMCNHLGNLYYISDRGLVRYYDDGPGEIVSQKIQPWFDGQRSPFNFFPNNENRLWSFQNYIGIYSFQANGGFLYYPDLPDKPFIPQEYPQGGRWGVPLEGLFTGPTLYMIGRVNPGAAPTEDTLWRRYDITATGAINCWWFTPWFDFDDPFTEKLIYELSVIHRGQLRLSYEKDHDTLTGTQTAFPNGGPLTDEPSYAESVIDTEAYGRAFRLKVESSIQGNAKTQAQANYQAQSGGSPISRAMYQAAISRIRIRARRLGDHTR